MTKIASSYTFRALDAEGHLIAQSRGRAGALAKIIGELHHYRNAVASASGRLYGDPQRLGSYSVDGIENALGVTWLIGEYADEIAGLDRLGVARVAQIRDEVVAEMAAQRMIDHA